MKKSLILLLSIIVIIGCMVFLVACDEPLDELSLVKDKVSYVESNIMTAESASYNVRLISGKKEKQFIADGVMGEMCDYATLTLKPINLDMFDKKFSFTVVGEKGEISGEMKKSMLGVSFTASLDVAKDIGSYKKVKITYGEKTDEIVFNNALEGKINSDKALEYAYNAVKDTLTKDFVDNKFNREVYVKFVNDRTNHQSPYYWYVAMLKDTKNYVSVLIDPINGNIINIKDTISLNDQSK